MSKPAYSVIKKPILTEKSAGLAEDGKYVFEVFSSVERTDVKSAVEARYKVTVTKVNIINTKGKVKTSRMQRGAQFRRPDVKKAVVTLEKGQKIELA